MERIAESVKKILEGPIEEMSYELWDVEYVKEGPVWYLRVTIDSENGISINDCERVYHAIDPLLDMHDLIQNSYNLEVTSPGIERELKTDEHINRFIGERVEIRLYSPLDGKKTVNGVLSAYSDGELTVDDGEKQLKIGRAACARIKTVYIFD